MKKRLSLISCFFVAGFGVNAQTSIKESQNIAVPASVEETIRWDKYGITSGAKKEQRSISSKLLDQELHQVQVSFSEPHNMI